MRVLRNLLLFLASITVIFSISCKDSATGDGTDISETLDPVEEVILIPGAENTTVTVHLNKDEQAYFSLDFSEIEHNDVIDNGTMVGWCIDVWKPVDHNGGIYEDRELYSTDMVEKWKPLNYLLNIQEDLKASDPDLSWREIQLAMWSLRANPEFNLDEVNIVELPGEMRSGGEPKYSQDKVEEILEKVEREYEAFDYAEGSKFAVIIAMPEDLQTMITVVEKK